MVGQLFCPVSLLVVFYFKIDNLLVLLGASGRHHGLHIIKDSRSEQRSTIVLFYNVIFWPAVNNGLHLDMNQSKLDSQCNNLCLHVLNEDQGHDLI